MENQTFSTRVALFFRTLFNKDTLVVAEQMPVPSELRHVGKESARRAERVTKTDPISHLMFHLGSLDEDLRALELRGEDKSNKELLCDHQGLKDLIQNQLIQHGTLHIPTVVRCERAGFHIVHHREEETVLIVTPHGKVTVDLTIGDEESESFESSERDLLTRLSTSTPKTVSKHHDTTVAYSA